MSQPLRILGISGSLRTASFNSSLLRAAQQLLPPETSLAIFGLDGIPAFNQDHEQQAPDSVVRLKQYIRSADAILFACPEYNYSFSGVLKNAIDWASRPHGDNVWAGKPVAIMGASIGNLGSVRAQYQLRQVFVYLDMYPLNQPEVMLAKAHEKISSDGTLTDEDTKRRIQQLIEALTVWTRRLAPTA
jgi:chromate reductase, NAD(P)H dehydrogenase (quinone)